MPIDLKIITNGRLSPCEGHWASSYNNNEATRKSVLSGYSKRRPKVGFQDRLSLNVGQKYCRMLQESILQYFRHSLSYHLSTFEWPLKTYFTVSNIVSHGNREHSVSVVECLTRDREAACSSLTGVTVLCPSARHIYHCLVLVQHRKTRPDKAEKLLTGT